MENEQTTSDQSQPNQPDAPLYDMDITAGISAIAENEWNRLVGTQSGEDDYNPFMSYAFLKALEDSESVGTRTGWGPQFITLRDKTGALVGALPAYVKSHSQGEYVFDHAWSDALERGGGRYYPKLQICAPFTPATGPRLLVARDNGKPGHVRRALGQTLMDLTQNNGLSSAHVTFAQSDDVETLVSLGYLKRLDQQFHFINRDYKSFDDFLDTLASRKRKNLRKEREAATENGISIGHYHGQDITPELLDAFYGFYTDTGNRKWGRPYLTRPFFDAIAQTMPDDILFIMAKREDRFIAGAINFIGANALYGRHWGCSEHHPFLHFEICYYQAIDFAIANNLARVEAGAQGEHKLARGYEPVQTRSAHFISHPGLRNAVADYLENERADIAAIGEILQSHTPFKKGARLVTEQENDNDGL